MKIIINRLVFSVLKIKQNLKYGNGKENKNRLFTVDKMSTYKFYK